MYRLIKEVHWSEPVAPFDPVVNTIITVHNLGGATYEVTFSDPVTWLGSTFENTDLAIFTSTGGGWWSTQIIAQPGANVIHIQQNGATDTNCSKVMITGSVAQLTSVIPFAIATPITPVT